MRVSFLSLRSHAQAVANEDFETADQLNESIAAAKADEDAKRAAVASAESTTLALTRRASEALDAQLAALRASAAEASADADAQAQAQALALADVSSSSSAPETNGDAASTPEAAPNAEAEAEAAVESVAAAAAESESTLDATGSPAASAEDEVAASE